MMLKRISLILVVVFVFSMVGCNTGVDTGGAIMLTPMEWWKAEKITSAQQEIGGIRKGREKQRFEALMDGMIARERGR